MNPIVFAMRRPYAVMVGVVAVVVGSVLAMTRTKVDVFPSLNQPVVYVCQPYGGMTPQQMEGLLTSYYEFHFLYVGGIHHIESKNIQGMTLLKLYFHPGTDMAQGMAETVAAVNRARYMMPPGTVPPFITRLDTGSAGVGYLVLSSDTKSIKDIQDTATLKVRPMFASVPGMSSPPAFGGNQRAIVITADPDKLRAQNITGEQLTEAVMQGNAVTPSGNMRIGDELFVVSSNAMVGADPRTELGAVPVKLGDQPVFLRDVATIEDGSDITAGYSLVNGRRSVYILVTKRSDASTVSVVNELKKALPRMREAAAGVDVEFAFDQSPLVTNAMWGVGTEGAIGAVLTGLMVLIFLHDWRTVVVVVLNIPLALLASVFALWASGQTINLMSLGGLALAVGILVDEATVEVENIHTQLERNDNVARAVRRGNQETAVPRLLAMLCVLAVFIPSFFMQGAARELFVPLSLAVGYAMVASYLLSSTFVPVLCVWLIRPHAHHDTAHKTAPRPALFTKFQRAYEQVLGRLLAARSLVAVVYFVAAAGLLAGLATVIGTSVFPATDQGQFQLRMRAPTGTRIERTEELGREAIRLIEAEAGPGNVAMSVGYVGMFPTNYPIQAVHQWTSGPEEMILKVALKAESGIRVEEFKSRLRGVLPTALRDWLKTRWRAEGVSPAELDVRAAGLRLSFEPGDLINEVMSFGSPSPVDVQVSGPKHEANMHVARRIFDKMNEVPELRDLQIAQSLEYPTVDVVIDRERAATLGLTAKTVGTAMIPATASSRYMNPIYWRDPASGQAYIVQVQMPPARMDSPAEIGMIPVRGGRQRTEPSAGDTGMMAHAGAGGGAVLLRDVATVRRADPTPGEIDRYNMRRLIGITANIGTTDLGKVGRGVRRAIAAATREEIEAHYSTQAKKLRADDPGTPAAIQKLENQKLADLAAGKLPGGILVDVRGQIESLDVVMRNLMVGLAIAILAIFLLLTAYFQSIRLAIVSVAAVPATLCGVAVALAATGTTLNLQSFMGAIMAVGVAVANAILLVTFAERSRIQHGHAVRAAADGGVSRLRPILMTSAAMAAGMIPMALGLSEGGDQTAPLGRAVLGGVVFSTFATLFALPTIFAVVQRRASVASASLDPDDAESTRYDVDAVRLFNDQSSN
ncbi:efflux RND transporter permease subunit [Fimbriiglobus ruber]|uniref:Cobalt-zinc-cadmium resistance protein CzcA / Cation efflux system protein CusA n=1 Tax=Fimbriiglobus ruber TaxID=1908690 RepID=A0A225EAZ9_9BACT|nr:efflux RND transporter permease subunit [Fimbriiglobus ruber]OWK46559.1 Cobalt-zinc-cadmium resistance protein CzcA / Cation efflux system protein CusA [Fimbriiglobus ruber]